MKDLKRNGFKWLGVLALMSGLSACSIDINDDDDKNDDGHDMPKYYMYFYVCFYALNLSDQSL